DGPCRGPRRHRRGGGPFARPRPGRRGRGSGPARPVRGRPAQGKFAGKTAMSAGRPLRVGIVAGEESGDLLGADIVAALESATGREVGLVGLGGRHLQALGRKPLFDAGDIALMGFSAVLRDLPRLIKRIGETARAIVAAKPDCLITIDNPDFTL